MFGPLSQGFAPLRPVLPAGWRAVARPLASSTAGIVLGAALVAGAALRLAPEPPVTAVTETPAATAPAVQLVPPTVAPAPPEPSAAPAAAAPAPAAAPAAPAPALEARAYRSGGRAYAALTVPAGVAIEAPFAGRVEVRSYQFIEGQVRIGANVPSLPYFPYVVVRAGDRVLTLRPGALGTDAEVLVNDGATVAAGTPLVRVTGDGPSSWRTFYDRTVEAQVIASLTTPGGSDLDAVALFARH